MALVLLVCGTGSQAAEPHAMEFLQGLRKQGYGDTAVEYLKLLQKQGNLPPGLRETYDLEMSESLRVAARDAYNAREAQQFAEEARSCLEKFVREKPDDYRTGSAIVTLGLLSADKALKLLDETRDADEQERAKLLEQARQALVDARGQFQKAIEKFESPVAARPPEADPKQKKRSRGQDLAEKWEFDRQNAHFQAALVDYYLAKTYGESQGEERTAAMKKAAQAFDDLFQANRLNIVGLYAHMWHGKVLEELGDLETALDIYDEVLANSPDSSQSEVDPEFQSLFAQVELSRLLILGKQKSAEQFAAEATEWLRANRDSRKTEGYQGIALELAKTLLAQGDKAFSEERAKLTSRALGLLGDVASVRSPYQQEAIRLRSQHSKTLGEIQPKTFEEALGVADLAANAGAWKEAAAGYTQALVLAEKAGLKDADRMGKAKDALANAHYRHAQQLYKEGKLNEAITAAGEVALHKEGAAAASAAAVAVQAALDLFIEAPEEKKPEARQRLEKLANFTASAWPGKPEADDARMALAQANLAAGKTQEALAVFENVTAKSQRYPAAVYLAGVTYWRRYVIEKSKPDAARNKTQMASDRAKAEELLSRSLELQKKTESGNSGPTRQQVETQLLLAEIAMEGGQKEKGEELLKPLVADIRRKGLSPDDATAVAITVAALRVYLSTGDLASATELGRRLADSGVDTAAANAALLRLVYVLMNSRTGAQPAEAAGTKSAAPVAKPADSAAATEPLKKILPKLAAREHLSPTAMAYVADGLATIGQKPEAQALYRRLIDQVEKDPDAAGAVAPTLMRARCQLAEDLMKAGKHKEAFAQISQVAETHPRSLPILMQQGRILQAWAERDASRYAAAVQHWSQVRSLLLATRPKPPEYYEVTCNLANCLYQEATRAGETEAASTKATQAEQLLKSDLVLNPKLTGEDMVKKYQALLENVKGLQARLPSGRK